MGRSPGVAFQLISAICSLLYIWHLGLNWWLCLCIWAFSFLSKFSELQETGNAGVCQSLLSLSPWDGYRITPWTRRKVWCLTLLIFRRDSWCLSTIRDPRPWAAFMWWWWEALYLTITMADKHCLSVTETAPCNDLFPGSLCYVQSCDSLLPSPIFGLAHMPFASQES